MKGKKLYELTKFYNYFEPGMKTEIINSEYSNDVYIISLIKNIVIYVIKINDMETWDKSENFNFGNVKNKGIVNLGNFIAFIYYDKKAVIINVSEAFKSKINPNDTFLFPFDIIYAYHYNGNIILVSNCQIFLFDYQKKKIEKEMSIGFKIVSDENMDINILQIQGDVYILIVGLNHVVFNVKTFCIIDDFKIYNIKQKTILFFNSLPECFEIIKKDIVTNKVIQIFREETDEQKHKMKYLKNNKIFVGSYPNRFFIFDN